MIRNICTVLVILGLIFQPFANAVSASMNGDGMDHADANVKSSMKMEHAQASMADDSSMPCHKAVEQGISTQDCDGCCSFDCQMVRHCVSSYTVGLLAAIQQSSIPAGLTQIVLPRPHTASQALGQPSFIYHPPKHS